MTSIGRRLATAAAAAAVAGALAISAPTVVATFAALAPIVTHAPIAGIAVPVPMVACTVEDGSADGQAFPCTWDAATQGNRQGTSFVLFAAA